MVEDMEMSVVLRCTKCSGVLTEKLENGTTKLYCETCRGYPGHMKQTVDGSYETQSIALLTQIRDSLANLNRHMDSVTTRGTSSDDNQGSRIRVLGK